MRPKPGVGDRRDELDALGLEVGHGGLDVVAHQIELVATAVVGRRGVAGELGGRQREDQPAAAGVDRARAEDLVEEGARGLGVLREDDRVGAGDHLRSLRRYAASPASNRSRIVLAALAGSRRRATTSSSSSANSSSSARRSSRPRRRRKVQSAEDLVAQVAPAALGERALLHDVLAVVVELLDELLDALAADGLGLDDRHAPAALRREREHAADLAHHRVGQRVVGLVDDDDVGDLHDPRP